MFENVIEFSAPEAYVQNEEENVFPSPIKKNMPEWFKKLKHGFPKKTVKGCMPFLDTLTSGYLLKNPQDLHIVHAKEHTSEDGKNMLMADQQTGFTGFHEPINLKHKTQPPEMQGINQVEGWPKLEKNLDGPIHKFINPWKIKTPPGYSCLFLPVLNNNDSRFEIIPGIVDTDSFPLEINFPFILNGYKYKAPIEFIIKKGTPIVQVFPFKRQKWKMKISPYNIKKRTVDAGLFDTTILNSYKNSFWYKKDFK
jgi:hypothetical protein